MKVLRLKAKNIGILNDIDIEINKPMLIFYGDIQQGKTTLLNCIRWLAGGKAVNIPKNLIRTGCKEAFIEIELESGRIKREFYLNKDGELTAKKLEAVIDSNILNQDQVTALFNPFLLDQNHFVKMNSIDKTKFLLEVFGVDTSEFDSEYKLIESGAKELRQKIKMYGEIDITPVELIDVSNLKKEKDSIQQKYDIESNKVASNNNLSQNRLNQRTQCSEKINTLKIELEKCEKWLLENPEIQLLQPIEKPDTSSIDEQLMNAKAIEVRHEQYQENFKKQKEKESDIDFLKEKENEQRNIKTKKAQLLQSISGKIEGLEFNENGDFSYLGTTSDMLSDSQQIELSSKLSGLYPEGLKIELIDRGESLGKSIFNLIDSAKEKEKSILVSVVGEKPAKIPENIGVFVVENGSVK